MKKELNNRELAIIKRIAQNVDGNFTKVKKLEAKIADLKAQVDELQVEIDEMEAPVIRMTGVRSTDLFEKQVLPYVNADGTPKKDKDGRPLKITKYVLKAQVENPENVETPEVSTTGSDFDLDKMI